MPTPENGKHTKKNWRQKLTNYSSVFHNFSGLALKWLSVRHNVMRKNGMQKKNTQKKKMEQIKPTLNVQINLNLDLSLKF